MLNFTTNRLKEKESEKQTTIKRAKRTAANEGRSDTSQRPNAEDQEQIEEFLIKGLEG